MTTIVADRVLLTMSADSRVSDSVAGICFKTQKLFELSSGELIGVSGGISDALKFVKWYADGCDPDDQPEIGDGFNAIVLDRCGRMSTYDFEFVGVEVLDEFFAIGSGAMAAIGAMHMGATPAQAVLVAAKVDSSTNSDVHSLTIDRRKGGLI